MTNEEMIKLYRNGDKEILKDIIENNKGAVFNVAKRYKSIAPAYMDIDDLIQIGYIGLMDAVEKYQFDKGAKFSSYIFSYIKWYIIRELRVKTREKMIISTVSLEKPLSSEGEHTIIDTLEDTSIKFVEDITDKEAEKAIYQILDEVLSEKEKFVFIEKCVRNRTYTSIAEDLKVNTSYVRDICTNARRKLLRKDYLFEKYLDLKTDYYKRGRNSVIDDVLFRERQREYEDIEEDESLFSEEDEKIFVFYDAVIQSMKSLRV